MATEVIATAEFIAWYDDLDESARTAVRYVVDMLEEAGVSLPFPHSSAVKDSKLAMRELRVQHLGEPYRVLYVFDPRRQAVLLLGGNKVGKGNRWYKAAIARAERAYASYLDEIGRE